MSKLEVEDFVFVTAASDNHFRELKSALAQLRFIGSQRLVLAYDLGLSDDNRKEVRLQEHSVTILAHLKRVFQLKSWFNVSVETFDASEFPNHVSNLETYAWKPLIILVPPRRKHVVHISQ